MLGEPVRRITWLAMVLAGSGVVVIAAPGIGAGRLAGSLLALVSCVCFALFSVTLRRGRSLDGTPSLLMAAVLAAAACARHPACSTVGSEPRRSAATTCSPAR